MLNRIWKKFTAALLLVSFIPLGYFAYKDLKEAESSVAYEMIRTIYLNTLSRGKDIEIYFKNTQTDINYLRANILMNLYSESVRLGQSAERWRKLLEEEFGVFLDVKRGYSRLGFLDEYGNEVVVAYRSGEEILYVPGDQRRNHLNASFYVEAAMLDNFGIAAMPMRTEIDPGLDLKSYTLIRYSTKVFDGRGRPVGIIYLDLNSVEIFDTLGNTSFNRRRPAGMITNEGNYMFIPFEDKKNSGIFAMRPLNVSKDYSEKVLNQLLSGQPGIISDDEKSLFAYYPVYPQPGKRSFFYIVFDEFKRENYVATIEKIKGKYLAGILLALGLCLVVSLAVSYAMTRQLKKLQEGAEMLRNNRLDHRLTIRSGDELESLANAYNMMADALQDYSHSLEQKVEERSRHIKRVEGKLIQAEKLASVGFLAAGVAHEINNPISVIATRIELMMKAVKKGDTAKIRDDLEVLLHHARRISQITGDLLVFSRMKPESAQEVDINVLIKRILSLVEPPIRKKGIALRIDLAEGLPPVLASTMGIEQVVYNILHNAYQATGENGAIAVKSALNYGGQVVLEIADNGRGIPQEVIDRIFEPFFTTKDVGQGTGLGLSISYGIIKEFGGSINVSSDPENGTVFTVTMEAASARESAPGGKVIG